MADLDDKNCTDVEGCRLLKTCSACPEQYDVYRGGKQIGYLRLRHGHFRADYPDCGGETVYEAEPRGNGAFDPDERSHFLSEAVRALKAHHRAIQ